MNQRAILISGIVFGGLAVALGAFGAHALKPMLVLSNRVDTYETAVRYQFYHALILIIAGLMMDRIQSKEKLQWAALSWVIGILLFSGSLYLLCFTQVTAFAFLTPIGGFGFLAGWVFLFLSAWKK